MTPDNLAAQAAHTLLLSAHDPERALAMLCKLLARHPETATDRAMADMATAALDVRRAAQQQSARFMAQTTAEHEARLRAQLAEAQAKHAEAMEAARRTANASAQAECDLRQAQARRQAEDDRLAMLAAKAAARAEAHKAKQEREEQVSRAKQALAQDAQEARAAWDEARTDAHYP